MIVRFKRVLSLPKISSSLACRIHLRVLPFEINLRIQTTKMLQKSLSGIQKKLECFLHLEEPPLEGLKFHPHIGSGNLSVRGFEWGGSKKKKRQQNANRTWSYTGMIKRDVDVVFLEEIRPANSIQARPANSIQALWLPCKGAAQKWMSIWHQLQLNTTQPKNNNRMDRMATMETHQRVNTKQPNDPTGTCLFLFLFAPRDRSRGARNFHDGCDTKKKRLPNLAWDRSFLPRHST